METASATIAIEVQMLRVSAWLLCLAALVPAAQASATDLVVDAAANYTIDATINGQPVRLRVDPAAAGYIVLNPAAVTRIGLRRSMTRSATRIGPVRLTGGTKVARVALGGTTDDRRIVWIEGPAVEGADGSISPADLPNDRVTFRIGAPRAGERAFELAMAYGRGTGLYFPLQLGERNILFGFTLLRSHSLATAGAGAHLAAQFGGNWTGEVRNEAIAYGVARPVRPLVLGRPLSLNGLELAALFVRTGDHRGNLALPPEPGADPDEVVVNAGSRQPALFSVTIGTDLLSACSSLIWDNLTRRLTLNCVQQRPS